MGNVFRVRPVRVKRANGQVLTPDIWRLQLLHSHTHLTLSIKERKRYRSSICVCISSTTEYMYMPSSYHS